RLLVRRPESTDRGQRPFGRIRGDFERALLTGNASGAQQFLDEMIASGRVSVEQRRCLEIRYHAGLGNFEELSRDHSLITSVMELPLPPQTLTDLIVALYSTYVSPTESTSDVKQIAKVFQERMGRPYGP